MAKLKFTDAAIRALPPSAGPNRIDYAFNDVRGFAVQTTQIGSKRFLLVYVARGSGRERRLVIGEFGPHPRLSVSAARRLAAEKRAMVDLGRDPWQERKTGRADAEARHAASRGTLGDLLTAYVEWLRKAHKASVDQVERELSSSVERPFQKLWNMPAVDVTLDDLVRPLNRLTRVGKYRQAEKTRTVIRAAYNNAAASRGRASASELFAPFALLPNIGRDLAPIDRPRHLVEGGNKRALGHSELCAYWRRIRGMDDSVGALLRVHLLTGAQRCAQLARLTHDGFQDDSIVLLDGKGRRKTARKHFIPLLPEVIDDFSLLRGNAGSFAFSMDGGKTGAGFHAVRRKVAEVAQAMIEAKEISKGFTPGELRITVETRLAAAGVPMEVRAQLQSHGLGGVQNKHYDKHDYHDEKRAALQTLARLVKSESNVVDLPATRMVA